MKQLMIGNEAIARAAYEAGATVAAAYPGTPSTEIVSTFAKYDQVYAQWAPNEKVALEVGVGASIGGARTLVAMKHVGVNVAADPLYTFAYTGVNGGLVLVSADDPGMHSSQNEQDNRGYGKFAKMPVLEPADSQEALDYCKLAFTISEEFDTPVMLRITTRLAHSQTMVEVGSKEEYQLKPYKKNVPKYVMLPGHARGRHVEVEKRMMQLKEYASSSPLNRIEWGDRSIGIISSGVPYQYVKEVMPQVSVLKLGMVHPLPEKLNGTGYPFHIAGESLPLGSRIMAVADVFTALTEDRPYRLGMDFDKTRDVLRDMVASDELDGKVVKLLVNHFHEINTIRVDSQVEAAEKYKNFMLIPGSNCEHEI
jgi:indolepyruvate ferredoxin oxidoreductase alpha subunit